MKILLAIAVLLAVGRIYIGFTVEPESPSLVDLYKDLAHVFIGGLGVLWWQFRKIDPLYGILFWGLNAVEVTVAILSRIS